MVEPPDFANYLLLASEEQGAVAITNSIDHQLATEKGDTHMNYEVTFWLKALAYRPSRRPLP
jgi:hypothetical protein